MNTAGLGSMRSLSIRARRIGVALVTVLVIGSASDALAQGLTLTGVWAQLITARDCATNAPLPIPPFRAMLTFHRDGTVTESVGTLAFAAGQRVIGHGLWAHDGGQTFRERTAAMILFDGGPGMYLTGWQVTTRTITMTDANHYTSAGAAQFYDLNRQLYRTGCATSVGERFQ